MRPVALLSGSILLGLIVVLYLRSVIGPFYRLPRFADEILSHQPTPPREVGPISVVLVVVRGLDGGIYASSAFLLTFTGAMLLLSTSGIGTPISVVSIVIGVVCAALVTFRVIDVLRALRTGEAVMVEVVQNKVGPARIYGTPWGDLSSGSAASGDYRNPATGAIHGYYMQQRWATHLKPGARMWVFRIHDRDVLYAPVGGTELLPTKAT
jgi:hypothetical protein